MTTPAWNSLSWVPALQGTIRSLPVLLAATDHAVAVDCVFVEWASIPSMIMDCNIDYITARV